MIATNATAVFVPGTPAPQGSAKAFVVKTKAGKTRAVVTHDNENTIPWRSLVSVFISEAVGSMSIVYPKEPVKLDLSFVMPRRKAEPKRVTPPHTRKPDSDKLARAVCDAITGLIYTDDAQIVDLHAAKRTAEIGEQPGVHIEWSAA